MGNARWDNVDWEAHARTTQSQTRDQIFTQNRIHADLDPSKINFRESRDSAANPEATPIILAADETGSMGILAEQIIKRDLGTIMAKIYDTRPVTDPHIMCMGIGDAYCDEAPLQVTQFEASVEPITDQVKKIFLEGNGGGNGGESYPLAWFFAAYKTKVDSIWKRNHKGYIFTIGDESPHPVLTREQLKRVLNVSAEADMNSRVLLEATQKDWQVFHLIVKPAYAQAAPSWRELLGERAIEVTNLDRLADGIVRTIELVEQQLAGHGQVHNEALVRREAAAVMA